MAKGIKHLFQIHHILPNQLFKNERIKPELKKLFGDDYLNLRDSMENKTALYRDAAQAETIKQSLLNGDSLYSDIGIGGSYHEGGHPGYNQFLIQQAGRIFNTPSDILNNEQKKTAFFDLARFATQVSEGTATVDGEPLILSGGENNAKILEKAWAAKQLDYTAPDVLTQDGLGDFIEHFKEADITDKGTDGQVNTEHRLIVTEKQTKAFYKLGVISAENYQKYLNKLADIRKSIESSGPEKIKGNDISDIFYKNSYDKAKADGQPLSAGETFRRESGINNDGQPLAQTLHTENGPTQVPMTAASGLAAELEQWHQQLPDAYSAMAQETRLNLEKITGRRRQRYRRRCR